MLQEDTNWVGGLFAEGFTGEVEKDLFESGARERAGVGGDVVTFDFGEHGGEFGVGRKREGVAFFGRGDFTVGPERRKGGGGGLAEREVQLFAGRKVAQ